MGLFSWKKDKSSQEITLLGVKGQIATMKCLLMAGIKEISLKTTLATPETKIDHINSYQYIDGTQKVPTLTQGDFSVSGARAILTYLDVRGKGTSLIPKKARTLGLQNYWVDVCYQALSPATEAMIHGNMTVEDKIALERVLSSLNKILADNQFIVGQLSFADPHAAAYIYVLKCGGYDISQHPNIEKWITRLEEKMSGPLNIEYLPMQTGSSNSQVA